MKKAFQLGLVSLATLIMLLHSFLPHTHGQKGTEEMSAVKVGCNHLEHSLTDVIEDILTQDIGFEHLEHFSNGSTTNVQNISIAPLPTLFFYTEISCQSEQPAFPKAVVYHFSEHFPKSHSLRGPPQV